MAEIICSYFCVIHEADTEEVYETIVKPKNQKVERVNNSIRDQSNFTESTLYFHMYSASTKKIQYPTNVLIDDRQLCRSDITSFDVTESYLIF
jgi:hypothetical protein